LANPKVILIENELKLKGRPQGQKKSIKKGIIDLTKVIDDAKEVIAKPSESPLQKQEILMSINNECLSQFEGVVRHCERKYQKSIDQIEA